MSGRSLGIGGRDRGNTETFSTVVSACGPVKARSARKPCTERLFIHVVLLNYAVLLGC